MLQGLERKKRKEKEGRVGRESESANPQGVPKERPVRSPPARRSSAPRLKIVKSEVGGDKLRSTETSVSDRELVRRIA